MLFRQECQISSFLSQLFGEEFVQPILDGEVYANTKFPTFETEMFKNVKNLILISVEDKKSTANNVQHANVN